MLLVGVKMRAAFQLIARLLLGAVLLPLIFTALILFALVAFCADLRGG